MICHNDYLVYETKRFKNIYYENEWIAIKDNVIVIKNATGSDGATGARDEDEVLAWLVHDYLWRFTGIKASGWVKDLVMYDILKEHEFNMFKSFINKYCPKFSQELLNKIMIKVSPSTYLAGVTVARPFIWLGRLVRS